MANVFAKVFGHHKCKSEVEVVSMEEFAGHKHNPQDIGAASLNNENYFSKTQTAPAYNVKSNWPAIYFYDTKGVQRGYIVITDKHGIQLASKDPDSANYQNFTLPDVGDLSGGSMWYEILTSGKVVTVAQGGTGANNKFDALPNLGLIVNNGRAIFTNGTTKNVVFEIPFNEVPSVILTPEGEAGPVYATNITTTGFTLHVTGVGGTSSYTGAVSWLAITRERMTAGI